MAKDRQLKRIKPDEHHATLFWPTGFGIEERQRYAERSGIKIADNWAEEAE